MQPQTKIFSRVVADYMDGAPLVLPSSATVRHMLDRMTTTKASCVLVADGNGRLSGLVTETDVVNRIALRATGEETLDAVMTAAVGSIAAPDYLYLAIARMRRHGWRHMPVVDGDSRPVGVMRRYRALEAAAEEVVERIELICREGGVDSLREIKAAQVDLALSLLDDGVSAPEIQQVISHINADIHGRLIEGHLIAMAATAWGEPPVRFALLIMGSGGRGENYLYPDQDNGFILDDYPDDAHTRIDAFYIELAERMTRDLDAVGFPFCKGFVMATNPLWRKTRSQWRAQVSRWGRRRSEIAIQLSDIFFDFHASWGAVEFGRNLRAAVTEMTTRSPAFLSALSQELGHGGVALGWFGRLSTETDAGGREVVNIKHHGTLPLVGSVRLLALKNGIEETSTLGRIAALSKVGSIALNERDYLQTAFERISFLLLRQQLHDFADPDRQVTNFIAPDTLLPREREELTDALKTVRRFHERVRGEFSAELF